MKKGLNKLLREINALSKLISGIFVTYDDYKLYMKDHPDDFCYWIHSAKYLNQSIFQSLDIQESNLISAMFTEEISNELNDWTQWTSWNGQTSIERFIKYKGNCCNFRKIREAPRSAVNKSFDVICIITDDKVIIEIFL